MQLDLNQIDKIPANSYLVVRNKSDNEDHIIKKKPTTGARIMADKLVNDVVCYTKKGMSGSRNSNFYEFLSLGLIPNLTGSAALILISNALNNFYGGKDTLFADMNGKKMAAGVILFAAGKWIGNKIINKGVEAKTGVDLDMPYKKVIHELPENQGEEGKTRVEFHKAFESVDFPAWHVINKMGEENGNRYEYYDKIAKKMGYKEELNAPDQVVQPKIKEAVVKASASKAISGYIWAALGCAIAAQDSFGSFMSLKGANSFGAKMKKLPSEIFRVTKDGVKSLAKTKMGKGLIIGAFASSALSIWNATKNFKAEKNNQKTTVDYNSNYMEF